MRGSDFNTGLRGVLFDASHCKRMGAALWLYGWLVLRQTHQRGETGFVLGGKPVSYAEIESETGFNPRTLERWMRTLRNEGYIETETAPAGVVIRITKAKKFPQGVRNSAEGIPKVAEGATQSCVADRMQSFSQQSNASRIGSGFVVTSINKSKAESTHTSFPVENQKPVNVFAGREANTNAKAKRSCGDENQKHAVNANELFRQFETIRAARERALWRAERDAAVKRELAVGTGPEVGRE